MFTLNILDMSCGHCASVITKTLQSLDPDARLTFDIPHHQVEVKTDEDLDSVIEVLTAAGYPATLAQG